MNKAKFVLYKPRVIEQYNKIKAICDIVSYSAKTNQEVTPILKQETDCYFSVHTANELSHINDYSRVIFLMQANDEDEIEEMFKKGIHRFIVDTDVQLNLLLDFVRTHIFKDKIWLFLRMKLKQNTVFTGKYFVFGMNAEIVNDNILRISKDSLLMKKIEILGVHFHKSSQNIAEWNLVDEASNALSDETLSKIQMLIMGGGFPIAYKNSSDIVIDNIFSRVIEFKKYLNSRNVRLACEPGRFIAGPSIELEAYVTCIDGSNIIVNASVYNSAMDSLILPLKLLVKNELTDEEAGEKYTVKGSTPCSLDIFRYSVKLKPVQLGDKITFLNAGAYNFHTDFCDIEKLETEIRG